MEKDLLRRIKVGDRAAFSELYDKYWEYSIRTAMAITKNKADAGDAVQEAFIRVYNNIDKFDLDKPFNPWFYSILINECNRILKNKSRTVPINDYFHNSLEYSKEDNSKLEEYGELYKAVQSLDDINKVPIILKYINDFSEKEIAQILNEKVNTIKSRLFQGRKKLKLALESIEGRRINNG